MLAKLLRFVAADQRLALRHRQLRLQMRADEPKPVFRRDLHGHIEKAAPHFVHLAVDLVRHIRRGHPRDDRKPAEQREVALQIRGLHIFEIRVAQARLVESRFEIFETIRRAHLANAEDVRIDFPDDPHQRVDLRLRLRMRGIFLPLTGGLRIHVVPHIVLADDDLARRRAHERGHSDPHEDDHERGNLHRGQ